MHSDRSVFQILSLPNAVVGNIFLPYCSDEDLIQLSKEEKSDSLVLEEIKRRVDFSLMELTKINPSIEVVKIAGKIIDDALGYVFSPLGTELVSHCLQEFRPDHEENFAHNLGYAVSKILQNYNTISTAIGKETCFNYTTTPILAQYFKKNAQNLSALNHYLFNLVSTYKQFHSFARTICLLGDESAGEFLGLYLKKINPFLVYSNLFVTVGILSALVQRPLLNLDALAEKNSLFDLAYDAENYAVLTGLIKSGQTNSIVSLMRLLSKNNVSLLDATILKVCEDCCTNPVNKMQLQSTLASTILWFDFSSHDSKINKAILYTIKRFLELGIDIPNRYTVFLSKNTDAFGWKAIDARQSMILLDKTKLDYFLQMRSVDNNTGYTEVSLEMSSFAVASMNAELIQLVTQGLLISSRRDEFIQSNRSKEAISFEFLQQQLESFKALVFTIYNHQWEMVQNQLKILKLSIEIQKNEKMQGQVLGLLLFANCLESDIEENQIKYEPAFFESKSSTQNNLRRLNLVKEGLLILYATPSQAKRSSTELKTDLLNLLRDYLSVNPTFLSGVLAVQGKQVTTSEFDKLIEIYTLMYKRNTAEKSLKQAP